MSKPILPASTVVIVRASEHSNQSLQVLLLRRNPQLLFAPNMWVFPGGKVEQADLEKCNHDLDAAHQLTAIRETKEETNLDIRNHSLVPISHWTTPDFRPKRFATQFYLTETTSTSEVVIDQSEIVECCWLSPAEALSRHQQGKMAMMAPTFVTLSELAKFDCIGSAVNFFQNRDLPNYQPQVQQRENGDKLFIYQGDALYQADQSSADADARNRCELNGEVLSYQHNLD